VAGPVRSSALSRFRNSSGLPSEAAPGNRGGFLFINAIFFTAVRNQNLAAAFFWRLRHEDVPTRCQTNPPVVTPAGFFYSERSPEPGRRDLLKSACSVASEYPASLPVKQKTGIE
jgi:hypothetical protein